MWFKSKLYESIKESDENEKLEHCFVNNPKKEYLNDFACLHINEYNYLKLVELCDFLFVENIDILVDKIIGYFGNFYKYNSQRLFPHNLNTLKCAMDLYL
jgi:hypothetical protein